MEMISHTFSEPFTTEDEIKHILNDAKIAKKLESEKRMENALRSGSQSIILINREVTTRKPLEVLSTPSSIDIPRRIVKRKSIF